MSKPSSNGAEIGQANGKEIVNCRVAAIEKAGGTFPKIARELAAIAFSDPLDYFDIGPGGELVGKPLKDIPPRKRKALAKIKDKTSVIETEDGKGMAKVTKLEYELHPKLDALKYLCRLRGDEVAKNETTVTLNLNDFSADEAELLRQIAKERARKAVEELNGPAGD